MMTEHFPEAFLERMSIQLGDEISAFMAAMDQPETRGIRMNPLKPCEAAAQWKNGGRIPWEENGYYLQPEDAPGRTIWHDAGAFYIQDPAAMIPVNVLNPQPGETILDLCAAPGGKSTQIGAAMRGNGILICNEPVTKRARILSSNLERTGIINSIVISTEPERIAERWKDAFDAVLVDAPCSGEGMFRRDPAARDEWSAEQAEGCVIRQRGILRAGAKMVRPGGRMVYSTCTFNPAENEGNVRWFLEEHPGWEAEAFALPGAVGKDGMFTSYPHRTRGEGQFIALLRRGGNGSAGLPEDDHSLPAAEPGAKRICKNTLNGLPEPTHQLGSTLIRLSFCPDLNGLKIYRAGLHLGEVRGNNFFPDHAAAFPAADFIPRTAISPEEAVRYMAGETVRGDVKGWTVVMCRDMALGWGKGSEGTIKNHYPKGLRNTRLQISDRT